MRQVDQQACVHHQVDLDAVEGDRGTLRRR
jgi:hypothetical protein